MTQLTKIVAAAASTANDLLETAQGCRASNLSALQCCPELYDIYPASSASDMASALVQTWGCELSSDVMNTALTSCQKGDASPAYTAAEISAAIAANISLAYLDSKNVPTQYGSSINNQLKMIGLSQGDLVKIKPAEQAMFLIISCMPGDYAPTPGSLIAAIKSSYGIDVASLAANKAADYLASDHCWISQQLPANVPYQRLLVFESAGSGAAGAVPGIFAAIKSFVPNPPAIPNTGPTIISGMVSTGSAGADANAILTALYQGAYGLMTGGDGYNMTCFRIVNFNAAWNASLTATFDSLKNQ